MNKNCHANHRSRMRERYYRCGLDSFAEHEALEVYLFRCLRRINTNGIAHDLLNQFGSLSRIFFSAGAERYCQISSVGKKTAFWLKDTSENMEKTVLKMMCAEPSYNVNRAMVFSRYMLRRIPENHVLVLCCDLDDCFREYVVLPPIDKNWSDWILQCLAVTKTGDQLHIWTNDSHAWQVKLCLQIGMELFVHGRRLRSVHKMQITGKVDSIYE